ncbi:hypothetical protein LOC71_14050 [Rhodopirellula sp. JC740]|uniref:Secreted protein n=1 Tax=Rhodopirellula halodulae TaxID=2894198 RepID=A0ABS8NIM3_9BACT|nr:hypothetical protein [Rhodopirellula sp. JC740]MCC9643403.1 hypothetical protein [Rhodopirellula sp. JC740]
MRFNWTARLTLGRTCVGLSALATLGLLAGCQQTSGTTAAPISMLQPGQTPVQNPSLPTLGPFGASARVPPPATGSYGSVTGATSASTYAPTMPYNSSASGIVPMSHTADSAVGSGVMQAGGTFDSSAASPAPQWVETNSVQPTSAVSAPSTGPRSGGMPVIDLTTAPPPPGYVPSGTMPSGAMNYGNSTAMNMVAGYPANTQINAGSTVQPGQLPVSQLVPVQPTQSASESAQWNTASAPVAGASDSFQANTPVAATTMQNNSVGSQPAANQPSFSTADRPVQWRAPNR